MSRHNRICFTCGKEYRYCKTCFEDRLKPSWYSQFCSDKCYDLDDILSKNTCGVITDIEAKEEIEKLDLKDIHLNNELVKNRVEEILSTVKKEEKKKVK